MDSLTLLAKPMRAAIAAVAILFVYFTVLSKLARDWWTDENYSHGLLIPVIIAYILWEERRRLIEVERRPHVVWGGIGVILALLALWAGVTGAELFVQRISFVLLLASVVIYFWGFQLLRLLLIPLLLLLLAIPIPAIIFNQIAFPLQLFASRCAVWAMELFGIPVLREGNVIELLPRGALVTQKLEVVEACSGIRSLMTLVTLAVVFAYFTYPKENGALKGLARLRTYGFWRSLIIVVSALPIAIITNAARVSGTGILSYHYGTDVAEGFFHSFSGWVTYVVALTLLFAVGWVLDKASGLMHLRSARGRGKEVSGSSVQRWSVESESIGGRER